MTDETKAKATRKPQEVLAIVSFTNAAGEVVDLTYGELTVTLTKDYKGAIGVLKSNPDSALVELSVPKASA